MSDVKRWEHTVVFEGLQISATYMAINDRGEYVMHDDYAALEAELARLRAGQEPDGCMIAPIQPTEEMRKRAQDYLAAEGMIVSDWLVHTAYTEMLAAAPSAPATVQGDGWIPVSERLPDSTKWVLVYADGAMNCMAFDSGEFKDWVGASAFNVNVSDITHWMPLPAAPSIAAARKEGGKV